MDSAAPRRLAREAEQSTPLRGMARAGYAANGLVHILIGVLALTVSVGGDGESDQSVALSVIADVPLGFIVLWSVAITLWALALWQFLDGILMREYSPHAKDVTSKWGRRVGAWGQSIIFFALGVIAAVVAVGARVSAEETAEEASRVALNIPGGPVLLALVALGVGIGGIAFIVMGVRRSFHNKIDIPKTPLGHGIAALGLVGFVAKGIALIIVGILLIAAVVTSDARTAGGLSGAFTALLGLSYGPWLVAAVGIGFISYGLFCFFRSRHARL